MEGVEEMTLALFRNKKKVGRTVLEKHKIL